MENKKFVNLPAEYKKFLEDSDNIESLKTIDGKTPFNKLNDIHNQIFLCSQTNSLQISDINHLMKNYSKTNTTLEQIKKLVHFRNYYILSSGLRSDCWKDFIIKLNSQDKKVKVKLIETATLDMLQQYMERWNSLDQIIVLDKKGTVKSIELIDPEDIKMIFNLLKK